MSRLDAISPALSELFSHAAPARQRSAARAACAMALAEAGLADSEAAAGLDLIASGGEGAALRQRLDAIAEAFDDRYFDLSDDTDNLTPEALVAFSKARAVAAVAFGLSGDSEGLREALYEALAAVEDPDGMAGVIQRELAGG